MGKLTEKFVEILREPDDLDYEEGYVPPKTLEELFSDFFDELDEKMHESKEKLKRIINKPSKTKDDDQDEAPIYDKETGKRILYVYDKNFDEKNYKTDLNVSIKKHPDSDSLPDLDYLNYTDSDKIIKFRKL